MVCLAVELEMMDKTREINILIYFDGFNQNDYSVSSVHCFCGLITYPVPGRVFPLTLYAGPTKPSDVDKFFSHSIDQILQVHVNLCFTVS